MGMRQQFDTVIEKTEIGFGIYFAKATGPDSGGNDFLAVDGFVEDWLEDEEVMTNSAALATLQLGDILVTVNGEGCQGKDIAEILGLLRTAGIGPNTLSFSRNVPVDAPLMNDAASADTDCNKTRAEGPKSGFMGALLKVKSKIRAEIDGDEEELLREQLEDKRFEKQWLEEFDLLKKEYEAKWETCTYIADEFCGLLYRSSTAQQKEYLLQEYPTLMEAWKDSPASSGSSRVLPEWPPATLTYDSAVIYDPVDSSKLPASASAGGGASPRSIHCSQSLQAALVCLRVGFMWRSDDLRAFSRRLYAAGISSCSGLAEALDARSSFFERTFQSIEYPRLSKTMLHALRESTQKAVVARSESSSL
ncbi:X-ray repair cross-complementing protein 6 [Phytophthora pseudosyringae]|uniref:X-ray repair cross-complementing protein 6 n=1 Tax=Phytophthora pseudosyringae TaxID=221518 RepID=A0A8T1W319_9STRA|nr:X-ray repair cross-complementing protein 6 [Phytophthora pseudosyringae]